jgi:hypothetical protein
MKPPPKPEGNHIVRRRHHNERLRAVFVEGGRRTADVGLDAV